MAVIEALNYLIENTYTKLGYLKPNFRTAPEDMLLHQRVIGREVI